MRSRCPGVPRGIVAADRQVREGGWAAVALTRRPCAARRR